MPGEMFNLISMHLQDLDCWACHRFTAATGGPGQCNCKLDFLARLVSYRMLLGPAT